MKSLKFSIENLARKKYLFEIFLEFSDNFEHQIGLFWVQMTNLKLSVTFQLNLENMKI